MKTAATGKERASRQLMVHALRKCWLSCARYDTPIRCRQRVGHMRSPSSVAAAFSHAASVKASSAGCPSSSTSAGTSAERAEGSFSSALPSLDAAKDCGEGGRLGTGVQGAQAGRGDACAWIWDGTAVATRGAP